MTTAPDTSLPQSLDSMDFETDVDCSPGRVGGGTGESYTRLIYVPKAGDPAIIGKILPDFRAKNKAFFDVEYHEFSVGVAIQDKRFFFSPRCWGEKDEMTDLFWNAIRERKKFEKDTRDYNYWDSIIKACRPKKGVLVYWVGKGESKLQYLFLKEQMSDVLFGAPAKRDVTGKDVPAIPGLIKEMREMGISPFNLKESVGWIKLFKTGSGNSTQFHAEMDQIKTESVNEKGRRVFSLEPSEAAVDPAILRLDPSKVMPFPELAKSQGWSLDEVSAYISSDFTAVPDRFRRKARGAATASLTFPQEKDPDGVPGGGHEVSRQVERAYEAPPAGIPATEDDLPF